MSVPGNEAVSLKLLRSPTRRRPSEAQGPRARLRPVGNGRSPSARCAGRVGAGPPGRPGVRDQVGRGRALGPVPQAVRDLRPALRHAVPHAASGNDQPNTREVATCSGRTGPPRQGRQFETPSGHENAASRRRRVPRGRMAEPRTRERAPGARPELGVDSRLQRCCRKLSGRGHERLDQIAVPDRFEIQPLHGGWPAVMPDDVADGGRPVGGAAPRRHRRGPASLRGVREAATERRVHLGTVEPAGGEGPRGRGCLRWGDRARRVRATTAVAPPASRRGGGTAPPPATRRRGPPGPRRT